MRMSWWEWTGAVVGTAAGLVILLLHDAYGALAAFALVGTLLVHAANRQVPGSSAIKRILSFVSTLLWVVFAFNVAMEFGSRFGRDLDGLPERLAAVLNL